LRVWKGATNEVGAGFASDRYLTLPKGKAGKLALTMAATEPLLAPVAKGLPVGIVHVVLEGKPVADLQLVALQEVPAGSFITRAWDTVRLWFKQS
jgi:D-alanyl-D-alanine carboxypeptidase (penicillin-binding protein 5/6)